MIGVLHPDPVVPFDIKNFEYVHFARIADWPVKAGKPFQVEWVGPEPSPANYPFVPIGLIKIAGADEPT